MPSTYPPNAHHLVTCSHEYQAIGPDRMWHHLSRKPSILSPFRDAGVGQKSTGRSYSCSVSYSPPSNDSVVQQQRHQSSPHVFRYVSPSPIPSSSLSSSYCCSSLFMDLYVLCSLTYRFSPILTTIHPSFFLSPAFCSLSLALPCTPMTSLALARVQLLFPQLRYLNLMQNPAVPVDVDELITTTIMGTSDADTTPERQRLGVGLGVGVGVGEDSPRSPPSGVHAMYVPRSPPSFSRGNHIPASGIATPPSLSSQCSSRSSRSSRKHYDQSSSPRTPTHPSQNSQSNLSRPSQLAQSNDRARTETLEDWAIADFAALMDEDAQHTLTTGKISEITLSTMNTLSRKHTLFYEQINEQNLNN